jgi:hypothetical protein
LFVEHAKVDQSACFDGYGALLDHFAGWLGLVEARLFAANDPEGQG